MITLMKRNRYLACVLCLLLLSCSKDVEKSFTLSENNVVFTSEGGEQEIVITANTNWEIVCEADWIEIEATGKTGNGSIQIHVKPNKANYQRSTLIAVVGWITNIGTGKEIVITQEPAAFFSGTATVLGKHSDCGTYLIQFDENVLGPYFITDAYALLAEYVPSSYNGNIYHGMNLPEELKKEGVKIRVVFRAPHPDESVVCTSMGPTYPGIFVVNAWKDYKDFNDVCNQNREKVTVTQGVWGTLTLMGGNWMPDIWQSARVYLVSKEIVVYEYTDYKDVEFVVSPWFISKINSRLIASTTSDEDGFFELELDPGKYSILVNMKDIGGFEKQERYIQYYLSLYYLPFMDGQGGLSPVVVEPSKVSEVRLVLDYAAH